MHTLQYGVFEFNLVTANLGKSELSALLSHSAWHPDVFSVILFDDTHEMIAQAALQIVVEQ